MNKVKLTLSIAFLSLTTLIFAQTMNEAGESFNAGIAALKAKNYAKAIEEYNNCIALCEKIGDEGADMKSQAESQLPSAYYNLAGSLYRGKKLDEAINAYKKAAEHATNLNKADLAEKSKNNIAKVYYSKGTSQYKAGAYDNALVSFDKGIEADPSYFKTFYGKGLVYNKQENTEAFKAAMDKAIELGPATDNTVKAAKTTVFRSFRTDAGKALQAGNFKSSIENIDIALNYESGDAQIFYFGTIAYNGLSNWNKAIEYGKKAVELEKKSKSNIYFEMGKAYEGTSNTAEACKAYKQVIDGPNKAAAEHKVKTELKCN